VLKQLIHRQREPDQSESSPKTGALDIETSNLHGDKPEIRPDRRARHAHPAGSDIVDNPPARPKGQESTFAGTGSARSTARPEGPSLLTLPQEDRPRNRRLLPAQRDLRMHPAMPAMRYLRGVSAVLF
jgi:hypothetical protein